MPAQSSASSASMEGQSQQSNSVPPWPSTQGPWNAQAAGETGDNTRRMTAWWGSSEPEYSPSPAEHGPQGYWERRRWLASRRFHTHEEFVTERVRWDALIEPLIREVQQKCESLWRLGNVDIVLRMARPEGGVPLSFTLLGLLVTESDQETMQGIDEGWDKLIGSRQGTFEQRFLMAGRYWPRPLSFELVTTQTADRWARYAELGPQRPPFRAILPQAIQEYLEAVDAPVVAFLGIEVLMHRARRGGTDTPYIVQRGLLDMGASGDMALELEALIHREIGNADIIA
ncbi:hypothetical protein M422DRAFT_268272 [Sphaerobolus stellatus SS14]|uniref:Uncharacterized protein n=1 Tax=Sphaerobolus stellatus (strain SS14) TaxID=990650 RepID=A0A0C9UYI8_SPHS4|nr:hypothetical protein M422DRAFT_268272 [Sphaerobolus stellatus SS14]